MAYIADGSSGLRVMDVSNVNAPAEVGYLDTPDFAMNVAVVGDLAYVSDGDGGLRIIDVSVPATPQEVGYYVGIGYVRQAAIVNGLAYLATNYDLEVIDVSNPAEPFLVHSFPTMGDLDNLALSGDYIFLGDQNNGLLVLAPSKMTYLPLVVSP
jgi:hypothetical protein